MASTSSTGTAAIAGVVDRPRLFRILDSPLLRVCVVQGPSGSGKTTLLRSWALQPDRCGATLWVSLGGGFTTRDAFWRHVASSATRHGDLSKEAAAQAGEELSLAGDPVRIATRLLADVGPVAVILDAYEHLADLTSAIDADLARLLAAVPELRVVITTRGRTDLVDLDLPGGGLVRVITLAELALTTGEIATLVAAQTGIDDGDLAVSVGDATRGFPLTVRAVVLALAQLGRIPRVDSMEWDAVVAARLESLLPDPVAVQFVTDTSVPPYVDLELAQQLSGHPAPLELLEMLERNGFGRWIPYARNRPVFQYAETIRDTFRARALDDAERFRRSCTTTALWLLENEEVVDQALRFAVDGEDYALADRVVISLLISNPHSYITDRFLPVLEKVPETRLSEHPMLAFGLGLALMANPLRRLEAPRVFQIAVDSSTRPPYIEPSIDAFSHLSMRAVAQRLAGDWHGSSTECLEALRLVDEIPAAVLGSFSEHVGTILRQLSFSIWQGGLVEEALATANRSVALCSAPAPRNYSTVYAAAIHAFAGETMAAEAIVTSIDGSAWPPEMRQTSLNGLGLLAEAYVCLDRHDFERAAAVLRDTHAYMRTNEYWPFVTSAWVLAKHGLGQAHAEAERVTRELAGTTPPPGAGDNVATAQLHAVLASAWMASGDHRAARRLLEAQPEDSPFLASARVTWLLGARRDGEALQQTRLLLDLPGHTIRSRVETQTVGAVAALRQGEAEPAWLWLNSAAVAWETSGPRMHVALLDPRDRRALWEFACERRSAALRRYLDIPLSSVQSVGRATASLTRRETVVLAALAEHEGIREVAEALFVSPHTVKTQLQSIYRKLGVSSRQSALIVARELGLVEAPLVPGPSVRPRG
ncbi:MAG: LuxR C-terminal-related transcriptional regulator [Nocardioides sp.]|uniref:helix-turn-helix transcriptional regulator n=1 Tax=Nocardioides sp. TaxID=35761 RepID=UPI0039E666B2